MAALKLDVGLWPMASDPKPTSRVALLALLMGSTSLAPEAYTNAYTMLGHYSWISRNIGHTRSQHVRS